MYTFLQNNFENVKIQQKKRLSGGLVENDVIFNTCQIDRMAKVSAYYG